MKFNVQRETLLKPLQLVSGVVERRQTLPVLSNVLLSAGRDKISLTATDLEVELVADLELEVEATGEITVPARKLLDICRTLPEGADVEVSVGKDKAQLKSGRSRFTLSTLPASEFPTVEEVNPVRTISLAQGALKKLIDRTQFAMAQQDVRYYLNGLMLEMTGDRLRGVATDGHRLALCELEAQVGGEEAEQVIVPRKGVQELGRLLDESADLAAEVQIGSNHIRVQLPGLRFTSKLIDGRFPNYERVVPKAATLQVGADREALKQALVRTAILSNEKYRGVRLQLDKQRLRLLAHNPEQEEAEEELGVEYDGQEVEIGFNVTYLLDALNAVSGPTVHLWLTDANSSCLITEPERSDCKYVIMPMRL